MKVRIALLILGLLVGVGGTFLASPAIEKLRQRRIVEEAVNKYDLPEFPDGATVKYAYHREEFLMEWYGFEIQSTAARAKTWISKADERLAHKKARPSIGEVKYTLRNGGEIEVRIFESRK